jgi:type III pantothenate kinase
MDIGNTATGIAVFSGDRIVSKNKLLTPDEITVTYLKSLLKKEYRRKIKDIIVSSVVPFVDRSLSASVESFFGKKVFFVDHQTDSGLTLKIDYPQELGADRIADSVGALHFFDPPLMVIDSGTATTFDIISRECEYLGGAIFPGIELSINSLAKNTAKLDRIPFGVPESILGTNTESNIRAGIFFSYVGGLSYMIEEYKKITGGDTKVVVTGGLVRYFESRLPGVDLFEPDLIYYGLKKIYARLKR